MILLLLGCKLRSCLVLLDSVEAILRSMHKSLLLYKFHPLSLRLFQVKISLVTHLSGYSAILIKDLRCMDLSKDLVQAVASGLDLLLKLFYRVLVFRYQLVCLLVLLYFLDEALLKFLVLLVCSRQLFLDFLSYLEELFLVHLGVERYILIRSRLSLNCCGCLVR